MAAFAGASEAKLAASEEAVVDEACFEGVSLEVDGRVTGALAATVGRLLLGFRGALTPAD